MHSLFQKADVLSHEAMGAAIEVHRLLTYRKLWDVPLGLMINFHQMKLIDGVTRMILPGANRQE